MSYRHRKWSIRHSICMANIRCSKWTAILSTHCRDYNERQVPQVSCSYEPKEHDKLTYFFKKIREITFSRMWNSSNLNILNKEPYISNWNLKMVGRALCQLLSMSIYHRCLLSAIHAFSLFFRIPSMPRSINKEKTR